MEVGAPLEATPTLDEPDEPSKNQHTIVPRPRTVKTAKAEQARIVKEEQDQERERRRLARLARARTTATAQGTNNTDKTADAAQPTQAGPPTQAAPPTPNGARPPAATDVELNTRTNNGKSLDEHTLPPGTVRSSIEVPG